MNVVNAIEYKKAQKRLKEIRPVILELDSICDTLYNRVDVNGVWAALMKLEDIRVQLYIEYFEHENTIKRKGTK